MTLDSDSPFRLISVQVFAKVSLAIAFAILVFPKSANSHAVNSANEFSDRLFADTGCLFINDDIPQLDELQDVVPESHVEREYDVFPMEKSLQQIAQRLVEGITGSIRTAGNDFGVGDSVVNLEVLVSNQVEESTIVDDPYWNYYYSCDNWNVIFNSKPDFSRHHNTVVSDDESQGEADLQIMITRLKQFYLDIEFSLIECQNAHQFANPSRLSIVNAIKFLAPTSELFNIRQTGALSLLANLSQRIESAGRLVLGLRYASEFRGDQFESSLPLLQH